MSTGRHRHREWNNAKKNTGGFMRRHPQGWNSRYIWYEKGDGEDIRLSLEDCEGLRNVYPKSQEEAEHIAFQFRTGAPFAGDATPFVVDLLNLLSRKYPHLKQS